MPSDRRRAAFRTGRRPAHAVPHGAALLAVGAQLLVTLSACAPATLGAAERGQSAPPAAQPAQEAVAGAASGAASGATTGAAALVGTVHAAGLGSPSVAFDQARARQIDGDYTRALQDYAVVRDTFPGSPEAAEATLRLGETALADDLFATAEDHLRSFLATYPDHPKRAVATLMLGRALESQHNGGAAAEAYLRYDEWADPGASLADFVHARIASIYFAADRPADGWAALGKASTAAAQGQSATARIRLNEDLAVRYWNAGDRTRAAAARKAALDAYVEARRPAAQTAAAAWRLVAAYQETGRRDLADAVRWRIVGEWPRTFNALQAMNDLGAANLPAYLRGTIAYANRRSEQAVEALTLYINAGAPEGSMDEARYMRAVSLLRLGDDGALAALDRVADLHPESTWAAEALWQAGSMLLRQGNKPAAAARFERLAVGYPAFEQRPQALYLLAKLLPELGNQAAGSRYMEAAAFVSGHEDFYTFRARTALRRAAPAPKPLEGQDQITAADRVAWTQWLAARGVAPETQEAKRAQVEEDARFRRGMALLEAGFRKEAEDEMLELVRTVEHDPVVVEHVAVHVREHGFFPLSVTLGHSLVGRLSAMGEHSLLAAPRVVQKLVLPLAFLRLVEPASRAKGLDPLLMLGMMKQESWFEPRAFSTASARGLTQFIPETARTVAKELNWPNWTWDDMNRPYVSVPFGAHYLSSLIKDFRGNYHFALAGYNGGPGNVLRWAAGDMNRDTDLFVDGITYAETREYVKAVTGNYELYKAIYYR